MEGQDGMSDVKKKKENYGGHIIKCLSAKLGRAGRKNI